MIDRKNIGLSHDLRRAERQLTDFKSSQALGGASFVNYNTYSQNAYDITHVQSTRFKTYRVTFTHNEPGNWHMLELKAFARLNNPAVMANPLGAQDDYIIRVVPERPQLGLNSWILETQRQIEVTTTFYLKLYVKGTTPGTITVQTL